MARRKDPYYARPPARNDSEALEEARRITGLDEEIALLRATLKRYREQTEPDAGLILIAINTLARTLIARSRIGGSDKDDASRRMAAVIRHFGAILEEDHKE
jgi:hypothetical protein